MAKPNQKVKIEYLRWPYWINEEEPSLDGFYRPDHSGGKENLTYEPGLHPDYVAEFYSHYIEIYPEKISILRSYGRHQIDIPYDQLSSVEVKLAGRIAAGWIRIHALGFSPMDQNLEFTLAKRDNERALYTQGLVTDYRNIYLTPGPQPAAALNAPSVADELVKLKSLLDQGALTQVEFDQAKSRVLAGPERASDV